MVVDIMTPNEPITGFSPDDARQPAPGSLRDPATTFARIVPAPVQKDAGGGEMLSEAEQREGREALQGILRAQRIAETLTGVGRR
jgi:hypothetical protein